MHGYRIELSPQSASHCALCREGSEALLLLRCSCGAHLHAVCAEELSGSGCPTLGCAGVQLHEQLSLLTGCDHCAGGMSSETLERLERAYRRQGRELSYCSSCRHVLNPNADPLGFPPSRAARGMRSTREHAATAPSRRPGSNAELVWVALIWLTAVLAALMFVCYLLRFGS